MSLGLITSAAYINAEMAAEFGALPPAFLPIGNARLYTLQATALKGQVDRLALTLPASFEIPLQDQKALQALGLEVIRVPDGLRLSESILRAMIQGLSTLEPVTILHGDTLIRNIAGYPEDSFSVHRRGHPYAWATLNLAAPPLVRTPEDADVDFEGGGIVSGLFRFSDPLSLLQCLAGSGGDFVAAINAYDQVKPLTAVADVGDWLDFGHLNTYYASRREITTERAFNSLAFEGDVVVKKSSQSAKMAAEAAWFRDLPPVLKPYTPQFLGATESDGDRLASYKLEYEYLSPLSDLHVFGALPPASWRQIFRSCAEFMAEARAIKPPAIDPSWGPALYETKTRERLAAFAATADLDLDASWTLNDRVTPSLNAIADEMIRTIGAPTQADVGVMHGDLCFSNILYDFRRRRVRLLDPRGQIGDYRGVFGDCRYDLGKLHHSVGGKYDMIIGGYFRVERQSANSLNLDIADSVVQAAIENAFFEIVCNGDRDRLRTTAAISVLLFLSMPPLHYDRPDRQMAFLANALRLYLRHFGT